MNYLTGYDAWKCREPDDGVCRRCSTCDGAIDESGECRCEKCRTWVVRYELADSYGDQREIVVPGEDEDDARCVAELRLSAIDAFGARILSCKEVTT